MQRLDILARACARLVGRHPLVVEGQRLARRLRDGIVGIEREVGRLLESRQRADEGQPALEFGARLGLQRPRGLEEIDQLRKVGFRAGLLKLQLQLVVALLVAAVMQRHRIQAQLRDPCLRAGHVAEHALLAQREERFER